MTATPSPSPAPRRGLATWQTVATVVVLGLILAGLISYASRRVLARDALVGWLRSQGVESQVTFQAFDPGGFTGALRIGPAANPDFTAEVAEIRYDLAWSGGGLSARPTSIRLVRPMLKARWHAGRLSFGSLDPLVEKLRKRPSTGQAPPDIAIEQGLIRLDTDGGRLTGHLEAGVGGGRLQRLDLSLDPATLKAGTLALELGPSELHLAVRGDKVGVAGRAQVASLRTAKLELAAASLTLSGQTAYPDLKRRVEAGPTSLVLKATARDARLGGLSLGGLSHTLRLDGQVSGWGDHLALNGLATASLEARQVKQGALAGQGLRLNASSRDLALSRTQGDHLFGTLRLTGGLTRLDQGALKLADVTANLEGPAAAKAGDVRLDLAGDAATRASFTGLGPATRSDTPEAAALKRALADLTVSAPRLRLQAAPDGLALSLAAPVRVASRSGGGGVLQSAGGPLYAKGGGGFRLALDGRGGLPRADLAVDRYRVTGDGVTGEARLEATASLGPVVDGRVKLAGPFRIAGGELALRSARCAEVAIRHLELGQNDVEAVAGELCPVQAPLFTLGGRGWRIAGAARNLTADAPFLQARIAAAAGPLDLAARGGQVSAQARIAAARLEDLAPQTRFRPLAATGEARLQDNLWRADFALADPQGRPIATAQLRHEGVHGTGGLTFDTGPLVFTAGGLQPAALSPIAAALGSPAEGQARFSGQLAWTPAGTTSGGALHVRRLDFRSPAGLVTNLRGDLAFTSLSPLRAPAGQVFRADRIAALVPLTDAVATIGIDHEAAQVEGASFALGGGQARLEAFEFPFAQGGAWSATIDFDNVQLADLVAATSFADQLQLDARVSGHVPVSVTPQGVRVSKGELHAVAPGQVSIKRGALSHVSASGGAPVDPKAAPAAAGPQSPYGDFVNQALEYLAFSQMSAEVNSLPEGRLGVLFHIKGEHRPPQEQQIRLTLREALTRKINRQLPLPSGTKIDLTLDSSFNLDQLLKDFADYQKLRGSGAVQPPAPTVPPNARRRP